MTPRLRVVQFIVQPVLVLDDGESLAPRQCEPITVPASALADFPGWWAEHLAKSQPEGLTPEVGSSKLEA